VPSGGQKSARAARGSHHWNWCLISSVFRKVIFVIQMYLFTLFVSCRLCVNCTLTHFIRVFYGIIFVIQMYYLQCFSLTVLRLPKHILRVFYGINAYLWVDKISALFILILPLQTCYGFFTE
jgi:hypothetical protein